MYILRTMLYNFKTLIFKYIILFTVRMYHRRTFRRSGWPCRRPPNSPTIRKYNYPSWVFSTRATTKSWRGKQFCLKNTWSWQECDNRTIVTWTSKTVLVVFVFRIILTPLICMARTRQNGTRCLKFSGHFLVRIIMYNTYVLLMLLLL